MKSIIKKELPPKLAEKLSNQRQEAIYNTYYVIDGEIYVHTEFYVDEENPPLALMHDIMLLETEMVKAMQAQEKLYVDEDKQTYYDLYYLALWFYDRIPSKDWQDLLTFLRLIEEHEGVNNFIKFPVDEPVLN
jgi:hypothetical protein